MQMLNLVTLVTSKMLRIDIGVLERLAVIMLSSLQDKNAILDLALKCS